MKEILPILLILACPLMMLFMMRGMHHGGGHERHTPGRTEEDMTAAELRRLRDDIDRRLVELDERVHDVEVSTRARHDDPVRT